MTDSVRPLRRQPTRLRCPWDSPGKNTGMGCHFLLLMLRTAKLRKGADEFELEMRNVCHLLPCSRLPFKGNSHTLVSTSAPPAQQSRQKTTWHQSPGKTVRSGRTPPTRGQSLSLVCGETPVSLPQLPGSSDQACGQQWLNHMQVQQRKAL